MPDHTNSDGLTRHYGAQVARPEMYHRVSFGNGVERLIVDWEYNNLPGFDATASGGSGSADRYSDRIPYVPFGSLVTNVYTIVRTAFAGGTSYVMGTYTKAGVAIDADGYYTGTELAVANMNAAGKILRPDGVDVLNSTGTFDDLVVSTTENAYLRVVATGTFTAGRARTVIDYVRWSVLPTAATP